MNGTATGGGVFSFPVGMRHVFSNCTISDNEATGGINGLGGGFHANTNTIIVACTIAGNSASVRGGGISSADGMPSAGPRIQSCIVADNVSPLGPDIFQRTNSSGNNVVETVPEPGGTFGQTGVGLDFLPNTSTGDAIGTDPGLGPIQINAPGSTETHAIADTSVAYGNGASASATGGSIGRDQRGVLRPQGGAPDSGAFELEVVPVETSGFEIE